MKTSGSLYVVATPIGNLGDISERVIQTLGAVALIACEDTRNSGRMLARLDVRTPTVSYHEHNEETRAAELLERLQGGEDIALISDAGTPLMSDPGYRLVSLCRKAKLDVYAIPGPCAAVAALSVSGLPTDRFFFVGFLPKGKGAQATALAGLSDLEVPLIFYLPVHAAPAQLRLIIETLGNRRAFLVREMTKLYETSCFGSLEEVLRQLEESPLKGEITLVVGGREGEAAPGSHGALDLHSYLYGLIRFRGMPPKEAIQLCMQELNLSRREVYQASLEIKAFLDSGR